MCKVKLSSYDEVLSYTIRSVFGGLSALKSIFIGIQVAPHFQVKMCSIYDLEVYHSD